MQTYKKRQLLQLLTEVEDLHTIKLRNGELFPSAIDHGPYEPLHDADVPGECPVCAAILKLHAARELVQADEEVSSPQAGQSSAPQSRSRRGRKSPAAE